MLTRRSHVQQSFRKDHNPALSQGVGHPQNRALLRRTLSAAVALVLGTVTTGVFADSAYAGPDQDRVTITRQHVDAPVPAWNSAAKTLSIQVGQDPADRRVLWLGRGWGGSSAYPIVKHLFSVPEDPELAFLGEVGTMWLSAPQDPGPGNTPIWAGIGVDGSLFGAASRFEAGNYVLDLVSVHGPGRMELFTRTSAGVRRSWSSHDKAYRTIFNPRHMHAFTTFSKPGRYELNVAAVARDARGKSVYTSRVTPVVWQVGGTRPDHGTVKDVRAAFAQARTQRADGGSAQPELTIAQKTNFLVVGDDALTDFLFTTGNTSDRGTLVVTIDGYYMTEVPVENGAASFDEMIGDGASTFQAIYIPGDGASARWASQPVEFSRQHKDPVRITQGTDELVAEGAREISPTLTAQDQQVSSGAIELAIMPLPDGEGHSVALRGDQRLNATFTLGFYPNKRTDIADCSSEGKLVNGQALFVAHMNYCKDSAVARVSIVPHPYANVAPVTLTINNPDISTARVYPLTLPLRANNDYDLHTPEPPVDEAPGTPDSPGTPGGSGSPAPQPKPQPQPLPKPDLPPIVEEAPAVEPLSTAPLAIRQGHLDIRLAPTASGSLEMAIKDDSLSGENRSLLREPSAVTLVVPRSARERRTEQMAHPSLNFLGPVGAEFYVLPETQVNSLIWPGFSTEGIDYGKYPQGIDYEVTLAEGPANGAVSFLTSAGIGQGIDLRVHSKDAEKKWIRTSESTHLHGAWVFSEPGVYRVSVRAVSGTTEIAPAKIFTFAVDQDRQEQPPVDSPRHGQDGTPSDDKADTKPAPNSPGAPAPGANAPAPNQPDLRRDINEIKGMTAPKNADSSGSGNSSAGADKPSGSAGAQASSTAQGSSSTQAPSASASSSEGRSSARSSQRVGRVVDISSGNSASSAQSARSAEKPQSGDAAQSGSAAKKDAQKKKAKAAKASAGARGTDNAQSASADGGQSAEALSAVNTVLGGYSPATVGTILAAVIVAGIVIVLAVRKSLRS